MFRFGSVRYGTIRYETNVMPRSTAENLRLLGTEGAFTVLEESEIAKRNHRKTYELHIGDLAPAFRTPVSIPTR